MIILRIPKPKTLLAGLLPKEKPDPVLSQLITDLAQEFHLGQVRQCYRTARSNSLNYVVVTDREKYVVRRHRLSKDTVAHEHQILTYLKEHHYLAPEMVTTPDGRAWVEVEGSLYSFYRFIDGYNPFNFVWGTATRREILFECGQALARYHQAVDGLVPTYYKWDAYRPDDHRRWREGNLYRAALSKIRPMVNKPTATSLIDQFARDHLDQLEQFLDLEETVEGCSALSKLVIHGDYAPWNILFHPGKPPIVLDFNAARLDLKIYDVILATFFFSWRNGTLDSDRAQIFQQGYNRIGRLTEVELALAGDVYQWLMGRSIAERLRSHYLDDRPWQAGTKGWERFFAQCLFSRQNAQQLISGLETGS